MTLHLDLTFGFFAKSVPPSSGEIGARQAIRYLLESLIHRSHSQRSFESSCFTLSLMMETFEAQMSAAFNLFNKSSDGSEAVIPPYQLMWCWPTLEQYMGQPQKQIIASQQPSWQPTQQDFIHTSDSYNGQLPLTQAHHSPSSDHNHPHS